MSYAAAAAAAGGGDRRRLPPPISSPTSDVVLSESDSNSSDDGAVRRTALEDSIFSTYLQISGRDSPDLTKIRTFLASAAGRGPLVSCLICLERIRPVDPVWSCASGCYALFHLVCIQSWAQQCSHRPPSVTSPAAAASATSDWHCPKCRLSYPKTLIPRSYICFCGKVDDPPADPWILPHSCGEVCDRPLRGECGHRCLLLCHPGPCPPCPKLVNSRCFCGSRDDVRRCAQKLFSCNKTCSKPLPCRRHQCTERCHEGPCPPCRVRGVFSCACLKSKEERECSEREFKCDRPCTGMLQCGKHSCDRGCHSGPCGDCPLQGRRTCPCGKKEHKGVSCDTDVPTCGSTCDKMLSCRIHRCPERCHCGPCVEACRSVIMKSCRCGGLKKEVPCYQDLVCERKCQQVRDCGRHTCKRRCCDGDCPLCPEICSRKLRCNNHKCPSPCHRGVCAPCPLMVPISCSCGETRFEVPCGTEKSQRPPKCSRPCTISRLCRHKFECRPHKCHYGACPPCRLTCGDELPCGHKCKERCHGPIPPPNPEFILKPTKKQLNKHLECLPGSPCSPCKEVVWVPCFGQHIGEERSMLCHSKKQFPCSNSCGNLLHCGNHYCTKICHILNNQALTIERHGNNGSGNQEQNLWIPNDVIKQGEPCEECFLPCQKVREPLCPHPCPLPCHSSECPPCKVLIKRSCHCGSLVHAFECIYYNSLSGDEQQKVRSCGGPCHRKLPNCPHLCSEICHPVECPSVYDCTKKVNARCACNSLKKEWLCRDVQKAYLNVGHDPKDISKSHFGVGVLPCGTICANKIKGVESDLQLRKTSEIKRDPLAEVPNVPKRKRRRERVQEVGHVSKFQILKATIQRGIIIVLIIVAIIASAYYGHKGILWLSDWMNEVDEQRARRRGTHPRFY
ncbi:NF-X1-type zinc finger protein NFXL2-like [Zingiber officinale]|uniref:NF-X1-type zinc finger protein NFXL2-like n=1 Tax=Zingiber officinale TaxID=94328 RepID=UPI001C4D5E33|nr:NF-X1-type zinc finger protein NFXL2-like [Zingiber officinale]